MRRARVLAPLALAAAIGCGAADESDAPVDESDLLSRIEDISGDPEVESKADSDKGPAVELQTPAPSGSSVTVRPRALQGKYYVDVKVKITDRGAGVDWSTVKLRAKKSLFSYNLDLDESWKKPSKGLLEVVNYPVPDCRGTINLCKFDAKISVKDGKGRETLKTYKVTVEMP